MSLQVVIFVYIALFIVQGNILGVSPRNWQISPCSLGEVEILLCKIWLYWPYFCCGKQEPEIYKNIYTNFKVYTIVTLYYNKIQDSERQSLVWMCWLYETIYTHQYWYMSVVFISVYVSLVKYYYEMYQVKIIIKNYWYLHINKRGRSLVFIILHVTNLL